MTVSVAAPSSATSDGTTTAPPATTTTAVAPTVVPDEDGIVAKVFAKVAAMVKRDDVKPDKPDVKPDAKPEVTKDSKPDPEIVALRAELERTKAQFTEYAGRFDGDVKTKARAELVTGMTPAGADVLDAMFASAQVDGGVVKIGGVPAAEVVAKMRADKPYLFDAAPVTPGAGLTRAGMTPDQRREFVAQHGVEAFMKLQ